VQTPPENPNNRGINKGGHNIEVAKKHGKVKLNEQNVKGIIRKRKRTNPIVNPPNIHPA
jgi:hypothetical protein